MLYQISYYDIEYGANMFAMPSFTRDEIVDAENKKEIHKYITEQKDLYGNPYKKATSSKKKTFGFDYISHSGAVKVKIVKVGNPMKICRRLWTQIRN